jgi:phosphonate transport system ATP-binding protein
MFVSRIVGLCKGEIVFDGSPRELTPDALTVIYGEEDWQATIRRDEEEEAAGAADERAVTGSAQVVL